MATEHKDGLNGYLCYLIHKVKYEGGAREYREEQCLNFDTETGELVKLEDVLPPASLALLPSLLTEELLKRTVAATGRNCRIKAYCGLPTFTFP